MGQVGFVAFHTDNPNVDGRQTLRALCQAMGVEAARLEFIPNDESYQASVERRSLDYRDRESLGVLKISEIEEWIEPAARTCFVSLGSYRMPWAGRLAEALRASIPKECAGEFEPCDPLLTVGPHVIYRGDDDRGEPICTRAMISLRLEGQTTPLDGDAYRNVIFEVGAIKDVRQMFEIEVGPVEQDLAFSV